MKTLILILAFLSFSVGVQGACLQEFFERGTRVENKYSTQFEILSLAENFLLKSGDSFVVTGAIETLPVSCHSYAVLEPRLLILSTTALHYFELLQKEKNVVAFSQKNYISSTVFDHVYDIGPKANREILLSLNVELVIGEPHFFESYAHYSRLERLGIKNFYLRDYLEEHPLGRAEWLVLFAHLFPSSENLIKAQTKFNQIEESYLALQKKSQKGSNQNVLVGTLIQGLWFAPKDSSDYSLVLRDAGAYSILKTQTGLIDFETVVKAAQEVDIWITQSVWDNRTEALRMDERHAFLFSSIKKIIGLKRTAPEAYPFWEEGAARPDLVLKDLVEVLHGNNKNLRYFSVLGEQ